MKVYYSPLHKGHNPSKFFLWGAFHDFTPDVVERAETLLETMKAEGHAVLEAPDYGLGPIAAVHSPDYLDYLQIAWGQFQKEAQEQLGPLPFEPSPEVYPLMFPVPGVSHRYPTSITGRSGFHASDLWMPIVENTWSAIVGSAHLAVAAADAVLNGDDVAYALCRPSGHHAAVSRGGGNTYLNNSSIAAERLLQDKRRVAMVDIDVHHGNGTQDIFYNRDDVLTISLHCDPDDCYPYFVGYDDERGNDDGLGYNMNFPLPKFSGDAPYLAALETACSRIESYAPDALVVCLGVDGHEADPSAALSITFDGFAKIGKRLSELGLPTVLVQEGGYNLETLGTCVNNVVSAFEGHKAVRPELVGT